MDHAGEAEPTRRADRRRRSRDDGRGRALQRRRTARRSSTSTWAARRRRSATCWPARRCCRTSRWCGASSTPSSRAVDVPVTLKIRTGWDREHRNARRDRAHRRSSRHRALAVHGRTRACMYTRRGRVRHDRARSRQRVSHPGVRQRRHRLRRRKRARARVHRRRRGDDRPRRAGPAVDLPRDRALSATRQSCAPRLTRGSHVISCSPISRPLRVLRRRGGRAHRAQAHRLVRAEVVPAATDSACA